MNTQTSYFKKALVVLMAVMMVFTMMPSMAWAEELNDTEATQGLAVMQNGALLGDGAEIEIEEKKHEREQKEKEEEKAKAGISSVDASGKSGTADEEGK